MPKDPKEFSSILPSESNYPLDAAGNPILPQQQNLGTGYGRPVAFKTTPIGDDAYSPGPGEAGYSQDLRRDITNTAGQTEKYSEKAAASAPPPAGQNTLTMSSNNDYSEKNFAVALAAYGAMFGTGLYRLAEHDWWFGGIYTLGGALVPTFLCE